MQGDSELFEVIGALNASCRLTSRLNRRQEQGNENGYDRYHDQ
jgi:hypothetical protein